MNRSLKPLAALALALTLSACGPAVDLGGLARALAGSPAATSGASATSTTPTAEQDAVKQVIESANQAQARAFNGGDPAAMKANATDSFYTQLLQTNRELAASGVTRIELVSTDFQSVSVNGTTATASTLETWRSTYTDGSTDEQSARNDYTLVRQGGAWKIQTDDQPAAATQPAPTTRTDTGVPAAAATSSSTSSNWSGYSVTGGKYTSVTGTWTVPTVTAAIPGADATWVGIGGIDASDLIQAGTQATVSGGEVAYEAWIEMLPASSRPVSLSVSAGDSVTVTITQKAAVDWTIQMKNNTTGQAYNTSVKYTSTNSSAEWVQEAPSAGRGMIPLDDFGTLRFSGASAVRDGQSLALKALNPQAITMINGARQPLAQPSVIAADGSSFSVTRTQAQSTSGGGTGRRRRG
ncbi:MAG TPA: G1 family glutamic endopeptidase [Methylomirabilota bacterium]|nr:G1 family glutamic endopeptidase [Methylomirabilota bacterium]